MTLTIYISSKLSHRKFGATCTSTTNFQGVNKLS